MSTNTIDTNSSIRSQPAKVRRWKTRQRGDTEVTECTRFGPAGQQECEAKREARRLARIGRKNAALEAASKRGYQDGWDAATLQHILLQDASFTSLTRDDHSTDNTVRAGSESRFSSFIPDGSTVKSVACWTAAFSLATLAAYQYCKANELPYLQLSAFDESILSACKTAGSYVSGAASGAVSGISDYFGGTAGGTAMSNAASALTATSGTGLLSRAYTAAGSLWPGGS